MYRTILYEVGEGIGNNVHATGTLYAMQAHPFFAGDIFYVRTKHPELWTPMLNVSIHFYTDQLPITHATHLVRTLFSLMPCAVTIDQDIPCKLAEERKDYARMSETDIDAAIVEDMFGIKLEARIFRRVYIAKRPEVEFRLIGLVNGGTRTKQWMNKRWTGWTRLAQELQFEFKTCTFFNDLDDMIPRCDYAVKVPLDQVSSELSRCEMVIANDCGLMHIADAIGVPTLGIFGATALKKNFPIGNYSKALFSGMPCVPCQRTPRMAECISKECMDVITPEMVYGQLLALRQRVIDKVPCPVQ